MQRIKDSGKFGVIAYALTEGAFWIGSVPFAIAAVTLATGSFPDIARTKARPPSARTRSSSSTSHDHRAGAHRVRAGPGAVGRREHRSSGGDEKEEVVAAASSPPPPPPPICCRVIGVCHVGCA